MSDRFFVDTNILMYAHDASAGAKHERAKTLVEQLWRDRTGVVSTQVFFSFHDDRDVRRIVQVRNSWVVRRESEAQPFCDKAEFEEAKNRAGGIEKWIEQQPSGTSVAVVLFGAESPLAVHACRNDSLRPATDSAKLMSGEAGGPIRLEWEK
jgi:MTH538 TIR-like domain (DUF1863)